MYPWAKAGRYVGLNVQDTGDGMPARILEHVFEPFFTTKDPGKGTGLGLSIVYSIVKNHGGYILAESVEGQGSCFQIFLPVLKDEASESQLKAPVDSGLLMGRGESILIVDDESQVRQVIGDLLTSSGYRVTHAVNGLEALTLYQEAMIQGDRFCLVIMDLAMPVMAGEECLEQILALDPQASILVFTGYGGELLHAENIKQMAKGLLLKPFELSTLLTEVKNILK
jgi:CheY-like chemotaxis protein